MTNNKKDPSPNKKQSTKKMLEVKTNEDFNKEKPITNDPYLKITEK